MKSFKIILIALMTLVAMASCENEPVLAEPLIACNDYNCFMMPDCGEGSMLTMTIQINGVAKTVDFINPFLIDVTTEAQFENVLLTEYPEILSAKAIFNHDPGFIMSTCTGDVIDAISVTTQFVAGGSYQYSGVIDVTGNTDTSIPCTQQL